MRRYTVIGVGAVGALYGGRLAAAGHPVDFVARSDLDHLRTRGLRVDSPGGDIDLPEVRAVGAVTEVPQTDVVIIATKSTENAAVIRQLAEWVSPDTTVLVLQNGLGVEAGVAQALPAGMTVLGGMAFVCANKVGPGHVVHLDYGRVTVGEYDAAGPAGVTDTVSAVVDDLVAAGVNAQAIGDLATGRWKKLVWNIPYNGLSVVLDAGTDELMADADTRMLIEEIMGEVVAAAAACGSTIERSFVDDMLRDTAAMAPYETSRKLDHDAGRPLELDAIYGAPIGAARAAGVAMPRTEALHAQLRFLDRRHR